MTLRDELERLEPALAELILATRGVCDALQGFVGDHTDGRPCRRGGAPIIAAEAALEEAAAAMSRAEALSMAPLRRPATRACRICGGDGWTDGSAELRGERNPAHAHDTTCVGCGGTGKEPAP